jgi:RNA polymerase sigma-70 factor, ECF subfamily
MLHFVANQKLTLPDAAISDDSLVARLCAGDRAAMGLIFDRHRDAVFRFALAFTGNRDMAHDVTQETFLQLVLKPDGFDPQRGALAAFLCGIARNCARAALRDNSIERNLELPEDDELSEPAALVINDGAGTAFNALSRSEDERLLWAAIRQLPEHYREVLILVELQDFSYAQAASLLAVEIGTVRSRLSRAKERMASLLKPYLTNAPLTKSPSNELAS